jgi:hypothetical protein
MDNPNGEGGEFLVRGRMAAVTPDHPAAAEIVRTLKTLGGEPARRLDRAREKPVPGVYSKYFTGEAYFALALLATVDPGGGWDATRISKPKAVYWSNLDARIRGARLKRGQIQVVWLKQAISGEDRPFPQDARALQTHLRTIVRLLSNRFPNLRLIYVSSRTYGGYAVTHLNPEPFAYETGFAAKWLVQDGIQGRLGRVWVGWGPYLWTDGLAGRRDGLTWACEDVLEDGMHPSPSGVQKVSRLLSAFFETDPTAKTWFAPAG